VLQLRLRKDWKTWSPGGERPALFLRKGKSMSTPQGESDDGSKKSYKDRQRTSGFVPRKRMAASSNFFWERGPPPHASEEREGKTLKARYQERERVNRIPAQAQKEEKEKKMVVKPSQGRGEKEEKSRGSLRGRKRDVKSRLGKRRGSRKGKKRVYIRAGERSELPMKRRR